MKAEIIDRATLRLTLETVAEASDYVRVCLGIEPRSDVDAFVAARDEIVSGGLPAVRDAKADRHYVACNGGWGRETVTFDELMRPYWDRLHEWTGSPPFAVDLTDVMGGTNYTHIVVVALCDNAGKLHVDAIDAVWTNQWEWLGDDPPEGKKKASQTFEQRLHDTLHRYVAESIGHVAPIDEFVDNGNGTYRRNPKYATGYRNPVQPMCANEKVFDAIFAAWEAQHATPGQRDALARYATYKGQRPPLRPSCKTDYQGFHVDDYRRHLKWDEFRALGDAPLPPTPAKEE